MVRSPSRGIDIIMFFTLHEFDKITILIDNGIEKSRKIIHMSTSLLCQQKKQGFSCSTRLFRKQLCLVFSRKVEKSWKLVLQNDEFPEAFSQLGIFNLVTDEVIV